MSTPADINSLNEGAKYWRYTIGVDVLPANSREKKPLFAWKRYQTKPATDKEFQYWLDHDEFKNGLCIITGKVRHRPDRQHLYYVVIDGDKAAGIKELFTRNGKTATIQEVSQKWIVEQHKDNPDKGHFGFYSPIRFPEKVPDSIIGLEVRCEDSDGKTDRVVVVSPSIHKDGQPYEIIGTKDPQVLTILQARELIQHINQICIRNGVEYLTKTGNSRLDAKLKRMIKNLTIDQTITITEGQRNDILIAVADSILFNHSHKVPEEKLREYFDAINGQLCKPEPLDDKEIDRLWNRACDFVEVIKERERTNGNSNNGSNYSSGSSSSNSNSDAKSESRYGSDQEDISLPTDPKRYGLDQDVYGIMNIKPTVLAVARSKTKQIVKAKVTESKYNDASGREHKICTLDWICTIVDAYPIEVVRNTNPLDEKGKIKYTVTFAYKKHKPFTIGPATVNEIAEGLADNGRVMKRLLVADALTSLLAAYEDTNKIKIDDQIPTPGYYMKDGKIVGAHTTQRLDFDPYNNEVHKNEMLECTKIFDEWQTRNKKKVILPAVLKWTALAPFSFITKTCSSGVDKWLPSLYLYQTTDTGKTTIIRDAVLATWGIYDNGANSAIHFKGSGSLDSPSKFGIAVSQTTLPILGDEMGEMFNDDKKYGGNNILEMHKYAIQNRFIRTRFNESILALASFAFTSNDPPPNDGAARRRFFAVEFEDNEVWTEDEKKKYEEWMTTADPVTGKTTREKISVFGDFVASYIIKHPGLVLSYSSYSWYESATQILKEFYRVAGIAEENLPKWLDLLAEQTIVQEAKEERQFELRGFLQHAINEAYRRDVYTNPPENMIIETANGTVRNFKPITFREKIDYCLENKSVSFLHKCKRKLGIEPDVAMTSNILAEMKKYDRTAAVTTMKTIAAKIDNFSCDDRWIGKKTSVCYLWAKVQI